MSILSLNKNENIYPHSPKIEAYLKNIPMNSLSLYNSSTDPLVKTICEQFQLPQQQFVLTHGGETLLKEAITTIIDKDSIALLPEGGWAYYTELVEETSGCIKTYTFMKNSSTYSYNIPAITQLLQQYKPKLLLLPSPNNPTGHLLKKKDLNILLEESQRAGTYIIIDEAYFGFATKEDIIQWQDIQEYDRVLLVRSFSKYYGLAGLRIGFGVYTKGWEALAKKLYRYLGFSHLSSDIALHAIDSEEHYQQNAAVLIKQREKIEKHLSHLGMKIYTSYANFVFAEIDEQLFQLGQDFLLQQGVRIKFFDSSKEPWFKNCIRITVGLPDHTEVVCQAFSSLVERIKSI